MCGPTGIQANASKERQRVVVNGAGPAGLLLCSLLLNKNKDSNCGVTYDVVLIDGRQDYASFTEEEMSAKHRSWMIGLADHGLDAIKTLPALYENYVKGQGVLVKEFNLFLGKKQIKASTDEFQKSAAYKYEVARGKPESTGENFIVDRNYIVAAIARYLKETHENDPHYTAKYETKCQYVDYETRRVLVRDVQTNEEEYLDYDLLVGCDGVRSVVREAIVKRHSDFQLEYTDIFSEFKQAHIARPEGISKNALTLLPNVFPNCNGIILPETGPTVNISIGFTRNNTDDIPEEVMSNDYKVVAEYFRKNLPFELVDYDDYAKQWASTRWNQTGMVHCNFYHSLKAGVVIMGDAAHATSPSIGMGMNTALRDAQIFSELLEETKDDFDKALPAFSEARVKEGNSLSDLAFHLNCLDTKQQMKGTLVQIIRTFFYMRFPWFVSEHPFTMIGRRGVSLSEVYDQAVRQGIMGKNRAINDRIRQRYFEEKTGMVQTPSGQGRISSFKVVLGAVVAAVGAYAYQQYNWM